jgi:hypothetical protein
LRPVSTSGVTRSPYASLEVPLIGDRDEFAYITLVANMLALVPVATDEKHRIGRKG